ncbi:5-formyltetrahydrofolate cyclo-ligase [Mesoplasma lactucae]|uniref:5-formyltetrahydrofolate cyclo-ligase n=1 Tax=Mesoplasma lactucae ATCC 49193 TaxID=81460 RepID=A0A291IRN1_9MOLU|nr:5-formyltetrahydrofolate cyclo-ligase [Mesoplasma lactucae]ATG97512.1 5-formyltetrahydrofolate cyclo-ligase [Mesoplasma lactucae ATCC 49193]ATZ20032.1 5-formyltetrahydrofolate cyclo-ligase [Mesoplasma lactucae ATCC 49193]MCL8217017.1 putative protein YqgN [Mesoplasma lactucae ATCC 49193]
MPSNKTTLREKFLALRARTTDDYRISAQHRIDQKVLKFIQHFNLDKIALYMSKGKEVETRNIINWCLKNNVEVYLPKVSLNKTMDFYKITNLKSDLELNDGLKIYEPVISKTKKLNDPNSLQAYFVPLICFDKNLNRIGFGQGYYDRYFYGWDYSGYKVGLARMNQLSEKKIDASQFDARLDLIITDDEIFVAKKDESMLETDLLFLDLKPTDK